MNNSGEAVALTANFYRLDPGSIIVLHDELDVDFGHIRTRVGGSSAGHNGIKSITSSIDYENYGRVRIGIGPKKPAQIDSKDFVLKDFTKSEKEQLPHLYKELNAIITEYIYGSGPLRAETRSFIV
jgi:PTH1 family peptidyl-tRNA hydrolase